MRVNVTLERCVCARVCLCARVCVCVCVCLQTIGVYEAFVVYEFNGVYGILKEERAAGNRPWRPQLDKSQLVLCVVCLCMYWCR